MATKLGKTVVYNEEPPALMSQNLIITWSCRFMRQIKYVISLLPQNLWSWNLAGGELLYWASTYKIRQPSKLVILWDHATNQKSFISSNTIPVDIYLVKVNNRNTRTSCEICSKLTIKITERRHWRRFGSLIGNFEHISHLVLVLVFLLLTLNM